MRFDRLVLDLVDWIRRLLWSKEERSPKPYQAVRETQYPRGVLKLVTGRDTPRAVTTFIFCPRTEESEYLAIQVRPKDWHIYLDWSPSLPEFQAVERPWKPQAKATHTITILRASHNLLPNGEYDVEYVFSGDYDFSVGAVDMYRAARMACQYTAILVARWQISDYRWPDEIAQIHHKVTRSGRSHSDTYAYKEFGP